MWSRSGFPRLVRTGLSVFIGWVVLSTSPNALAQCVGGNCAPLNVNTFCLQAVYQCMSGDIDYCAPQSFSAKPMGTACEADGNPCTIDTCEYLDDGGGGGGGGGEGGGGGGGGATLVATGACKTVSVTPGAACGGSCIKTGCCNAPNNCPGGKVCSGPGGDCSCPGGTRECGGTCYPNTACCSDGECSSPIGGNGSGKCSGVGGSCVFTCATGYKLCGSSCIAVAACCGDADCPSEPANHRHGVCTAQSCVFGCDAGWKACNGQCITAASCCTMSDCKSPTSACFQTQGMCNQGTCTYSYANGVACNADSDACTPNDKCMNGTCVADTTNTVKCVQRECHSAPACNKSTGNCDDAVIAGACGDNGCAPAGTCASGACSTAAQTKSCTHLDNVCKVGACDPTNGNCAGVNKPNGTVCAIADKCQQSSVCSGGICQGTTKQCSASGPCRTAMCNGTTGECEETIAPMGTSCDSGDGCSQNSTCDAVGNCMGAPTPDGTPCDKQGCTEPAACVSGTCTCLSRPDFGNGMGSVTATEQPSDGGANVDDSGKKSGCSYDGGGSTSAPIAMFMLLLVVVAMRKRRARA